MATQPKVLIHRMSIEEARRRGKDVVFIDTRSNTALSRNPLQIAGAVHVPAKEVTPALKQLPHNRTLVTYCT